MAMKSSDDPEYRKFSRAPGRDFIEQFLGHIKNTDQPETFPGLHPGPLEKDEEFIKLKPFAIDRKKRPDRDKAPCPMCHQTNKFLEGDLAYFPRLRAVSAIGHCCAAKETREAADREYKARTTRDAEEELLLRQLPLVSAYLGALERARPTATEAERAFRQFRRGASGIHRQLRAVKTAGARLIVVERIESEVAANGPAGFRGTAGSTREVGFGILQGSMAVSKEYSPVRELDQIISRIRPYQIGDDGEAIIDYITSLDDAARHRVATSLRDAQPAYEKFRSRLTEFFGFFDRNNIDRIRAWASHSAQPQPFRVSVARDRDGYISCRFQSRSGICVLTINPAVIALDDGWPQPTG